MGFTDWVRALWPRFAFRTSDPDATGCSGDGILISAGRGLGMAQKVQPAAHRRPTRRLGRPSPDLRGHDKRNSRGSAAATSKVSALAPPAPSRLFADAPLME